MLRIGGSMGFYMLMEDRVQWLGFVAFAGGLLAWTAYMLRLMGALARLAEFDLGVFS